MIRFVSNTAVLFKMPGMNAETFCAIVFALSADKMVMPVFSLTFSEKD